MTRQPGRGSLWRDRGFTVFLTAQTLSVAGDSFALIAVPLLVLRATGSVAQMGLLTGAGAALLTWAAGHFGVLSACVASGAACLIIATAGLATPIRSRAERPGATVVGT